MSVSMFVGTENHSSSLKSTVGTVDVSGFVPLSFIEGEGVSVTPATAPFLLVWRQLVPSVSLINHFAGIINKSFPSLLSEVPAAKKAEVLGIQAAAASVINGLIGTRNTMENRFRYAASNIKFEQCQEGDLVALYCLLEDLDKEILGQLTVEKFQEVFAIIKSGSPEERTSLPAKALNEIMAAWNAQQRAVEKLFQIMDVISRR